MLKNFFFVTIALSMFLFQGCKEYKTTETGLKYKIVTDSAGPNAELGGGVAINYMMKTGKDSVMVNTFENPVPEQLIIREGYLEKGLTLLSKGDSAIFKISADSVYKDSPTGGLPPGIEKGSELEFVVKVKDVFTKKKVEEETARMEEWQKKMMDQYAADTMAIADYLKKNKIDAKKTRSGVYYVVRKKGDGLSIQPGDTVSVHYKGTLMDGTKFDSSYDHGKPFTVQVGMGQVIRGWDEGLMYLNRGDKATLYIPSALGYGEFGAGSIPPNANLIFEVEILKNNPPQ